MTKSWLYQLNNCALTLSHGVWNPISYTSVTMGMVLLNHSEKRTGSSSSSILEWNGTEQNLSVYTTLENGSRMLGTIPFHVVGVNRVLVKQLGWNRIQRKPNRLIVPCVYSLSAGYIHLHVTTSLCIRTYS